MKRKFLTCLALVALIFVIGFFPINQSQNMGVLTNRLFTGINSIPLSYPNYTNDKFCKFPEMPIIKNMTFSRGFTF